MDATSPVLLLKVMDGLALRMKAHAENIANAGTPLYQPVTVSFEEAVRAAASQGDAAVTAVQPVVQHTAHLQGGREVRLDLELAGSTKTAGRYGMIADLLNRELQLHEIAMTGDRR